METTTIQVSLTTKKMLDDARLVPGETYDSVVQRALKVLKKK